MDFSLNSSETSDTRVLKQCRPISELGEDHTSGGMERTAKLARTDSASFSSRQAENLTGGTGNGVSSVSVDDHHHTATGTAAAAASQVPVAQVYDPLISASLYQHQLGGVRSLGYGQQYGVNPMKQVPQFGGVGFQQQYYPFTASQWAELEHQALIFKYMMARAPVPPELVTPFRRSLILSPSTNSFQLGVSTGSPMDAEPGRCRRTDGKKWRCAKPIVADQKYCERHIHRGRNRSRKAAEAAAAAAAAQAANSLSNNHLGSTLSGSNPVNGNGNSVGFDHKSSSNGSKMFFTTSTIESGLSTAYPIQQQSSDSALHSKEPRFVNGMSKDQFDFRPEQLLFSEVSGSCTRNLGEYRTSIPSAIPNQSQSEMTSYGYESMIDNTGSSPLIRGAEQRKQPEALRHFFVDWPRKSEASWCEEDSKEGLLKLALENANSANSSEDQADPYTNISLARITGGGDLLADVLKGGGSPTLGNAIAGKPPHVGFNVAKSSSQTQQHVVLSSPTGVLQKVTCFSDSSSSASSPGSVKTETSHGAAH